MSAHVDVIYFPLCIYVQTSENYLT